MKVLVVGDIILDHYIYGTTDRLNPENTAILVRNDTEKVTLGGAGNVYNNLISLGVDADLIDYDDQYKSVKTRIISNNNYIARVDKDRYIDGLHIYESLKNIDLSVYDYCILSDYNKGCLEYSREIIELFNQHNIKVIVDPKRALSNYHGAWLIKSNELEARNFDLYNTWTGKNYIITRANDSVLAKIEGENINIPTENVEVNDVTGAGDCFLAAFIYGLGKNYNYKRCIEIATRAATKSVQHQGTYVLTLEDVEDTIVFTNGCFDILHRGHIEYLEQSRKLGNKLIVGLNSDSSIKKLKGNDRPINNEVDRKLALEALRCVDEVIIFDDDTPSLLIDLVKPDIITKGGDYTVENVVGNDRCKVVILPYNNGYSTTDIIGKL